MSENNVQSVLDITVEKMKSIAGADTVIGSKIELSEGITAIPVFKITYGFAAGGSDFSTKQMPAAKNNLFGGGGGGGMTVTPVAFLVANGQDVEVLNINNSSFVTSGPADKAISLVPEMFDKIVALCKEKKAEKADKANK